MSYGVFRRQPHVVRKTRYVGTAAPAAPTSLLRAISNAYRHVQPDAPSDVRRRQHTVLTDRAAGVPHAPARHAAVYLRQAQQQRQQKIYLFGLTAPVSTPAYRVVKQRYDVQVAEEYRPRPRQVRFTAPPAPTSLAYRKKNVEYFKQAVAIDDLNIEYYYRREHVPAQSPAAVSTGTAPVVRRRLRLDRFTTPYYDYAKYSYIARTVSATVPIAALAPVGLASMVFDTVGVVSTTYATAGFSATITDSDGLTSTITDTAGVRSE